MCDILGEFCDEPTNECLSSPCAHSSQCFDHENQFSCSCVDGYTGHNCSVSVPFSISVYQ